MERKRIVVEGMGAVLVIAAFALIDVALGLLMAGLALVAVANFYMGNEEDNDAGT